MPSGRWPMALAMVIRKSAESGKNTEITEITEITAPFFPRSAS
jgi:hypothetical protein